MPENTAEKQLSRLKQERYELKDRILELELEVERLDEIAQTKCGEVMKLTAERDKYKRALENLRTVDGIATQALKD